MTEEDAVSRAEWLKIGAVEVPDRLSQEEMEELVEFVKGYNAEAGAVAAEALSELYTRPELFESVMEELIDVSGYYPNDVEVTIAKMTNNEDVKTVALISDTIYRVAKQRPELAVPHTDQLIDIVTSKRNNPMFHLFTLGIICEVDPDPVPVDEVQSQLCNLLDHSLYDGLAIDTLRRIGDPSVLPELRENKPDNGASLEAFREAVEELENNC